MSRLAFEFILNDPNTAEADAFLLDVHNVSLLKFPDRDLKRIR